MLNVKFYFSFLPWFGLENITGYKLWAPDLSKCHIVTNLGSSSCFSSFVLCLNTRWWAESMRSEGNGCHLGVLGCHEKSLYVHSLYSSLENKRQRHLLQRKREERESYEGRCGWVCEPGGVEESTRWERRGRTGVRGEYRSEGRC